jgi:prepilin-type N-terminal cleavage/methylation domain-containing protein
MILRKDKSQKGLSLIETLISLVILALGFVGLVKLFMLNSKIINTADLETESVLLAQNLLEEILQGYCYYDDEDEEKRILKKRRWDENSPKVAFKTSMDIDDATKSTKLGIDSLWEIQPFKPNFSGENRYNRLRFDDIDDFKFLQRENADGADGEGPRDRRGNLLADFSITSLEGRPIQQVIREVDVFYVKRQQKKDKVGFVKTTQRTNYKKVIVKVKWLKEGREVYVYKLSAVVPNT